MDTEKMLDMLYKYTENKKEQKRVIFCVKTLMYNKVIVGFRITSGGENTNSKTTKDLVYDIDIDRLTEKIGQVSIKLLKWYSTGDIHLFEYKDRLISQEEIECEKAIMDFIELSASDKEAQIRAIKRLCK